MSGRSAYVRKKATEPKSGDRTGSRGRAKSSASSGNSTINGYPIATIPSPRHQRDWHANVPHHAAQHYGGPSGMGFEGRGEGYTSRAYRPPNDFAYGRARRPTLNTEDTSTIEKSGLRSALDKRSDEVRKGLAKAFTFKKKDKKVDHLDGFDFRCESSATVRPGHGVGIRPESQNPGQGATPSHAVSQGSPQDLDISWLTPGAMGSRSSSTSEMHGVPPIKRWVGAGRPAQRWNKLRKDPELWDPNGDVLIFLGPKDEAQHMKPSFRLSSHIIEATESRYLLTLLRQGSTEEDVHIPPSPAGAPLMLHRHGQQQLTPGGFGRGGQPTPPGSEVSSQWDMEGQISYEMYLPAPSNMAPLEQLRHHITTRNVFALLYHASLVGLSLYQALTELTFRLESYMTPGNDNVGMILDYLSARGMDDVRNDPETAVSLLTWSERSEVRWEEGWRESFLHCAGMYSQLELSADSNHITPITRALLERGSLETQLRVQAAEERLATFQYGDMWPPAVAITASTSGPIATAPAKAAMDRLQQFLVQYYAHEFGSWPPPVPQDPTGTETDAEDDVWLTRTVAQLLQGDFAALYDYLVSRDIVWDESETRSSRKWMMVSQGGNRGFDADTPDLPITDMLIEFDNKHRTGSTIGSGSAGGIFGTKSSKKGLANPGANASGRSGATERRVQLAYTEATNICILNSDFTHSSLVDAFSRFEKADSISDVDPSTARRGRWVLIYGVLQTLATVSVDSPTVRYADGVSYHLSPRLKGARLPPWKTAPSRFDSQEAVHELSHCWTIPLTWHTPHDNTLHPNPDDSPDEAISPLTFSQDYPFPMPSRTTTNRTRGSIRSTTSSSRAPSVAASSSTGPLHVPYSSAANSVRSYSGSEAGSSVRSPLSETPKPGNQSFAVVCASGRHRLTGSSLGLSQLFGDLRLRSQPQQRSVNIDLGFATARNIERICAATHAQ
ncbi:hypothetical protein N0V88_005574 [Collariella sp. IMI 366227]|nr:hypothetical protein N0V88_005574 [Collariella sp. IMI 366227]